MITLVRREICRSKIDDTPSNAGSVDCALISFVLSFDFDVEMARGLVVVVKVTNLTRKIAVLNQNEYTTPVFQ